MKIDNLVSELENTNWILKDILKALNSIAYELHNKK